MFPARLGTGTLPPALYANAMGTAHAITGLRNAYCVKTTQPAINVKVVYQDIMDQQRMAESANLANALAVLNLATLKTGNVTAVLKE